LLGEAEYQQGVSVRALQFQMQPYRHRWAAEGDRQEIHVEECHGIPAEHGKEGEEDREGEVVETVTPIKVIKPYREFLSDGSMILNLHAGQARAWLSEARFPVILAGAQCIAGETIINNPFGKSKSIGELSEKGESVFVWALYRGEVVPAIGSMPFRKGSARLYKVTTESGREVVTTLRHRMLSLQNGHVIWVSVGQILRTFRGEKGVYVAYADLPELPPSLSESNLGYDQLVQLSDGLNFGGIESDYPVNYWHDYRPYDGRPHSLSDNDLESSPLPIGVLEHNCRKNGGVLAYNARYNHPYPCEYHLPMRCLENLSNLADIEESLISSSSCELSHRLGQEFHQSEQLNTSVSTIPSSSQSHQQKMHALFSSLFPPKSLLLYDKWDKVVNIKYLLTDDYYDLRVPKYHNYLANGLIHHNSGKTEFAPDWLDREIKAKGEGDYIVGSATFPLLDKKLLPVMTRYFCDIKFDGSTWGKYRDSDKMILSHNEKSKIFLFTGVNPDAIESATAKGGVLDECGQKQFRLGTWEAVQRRLAIFQGRCLLGTTPYDFGWLKTEVYDRWRNGDKTFEVINFESIENPAFPREEFERLRRTMPAWKFDMFFRGRFTKPAGLVYDSFDDATCIIDRFNIPKEWPIYVGHDFGQANPAALFYAMAAENDSARGQYMKGDLIAFYEYLPRQSRSIYEHVAEFKRITAGKNVVMRSGGNWTSEDEIRQGYTAHGWYIIKPKWKEVTTQIERVYALDSLHSVKIFRDLSHYVDQKLSFSYILNDKYDPTDKYDSESLFHLLACERYILSNFRPETITKGYNQIRQTFAF